MTAWLQMQGYRVNRKRVTRLLRTMGLEALTPQPSTSRLAVEHPKYPYLLRGMTVERINQVWSTDITYIRLRHGFVYLVAVLDWFSRYVLSCELSITLDTSFCLKPWIERCRWLRQRFLTRIRGCNLPVTTLVEFRGRSNPHQP